MANKARYQNPSVPARALSKHARFKAASMRIRRYEAARAAWIAANPQASPGDYQRKMTQLAAKMAL